MAEALIDLHVHTRCSDGALTPAEIVDYALARGLGAVAITDHDTIDGNPEALEAARGKEIRVIPGVEISTHWDGVTFHILGYGFRRTTPAVAEAFAFLEESRRQRNPRMIEKLRGHGIDITMEEVLEEAGSSLVGRPHFARVLVRKRAVDSIQSAFDKFLGRGAAAYVDKARLTPARACEVIREAGGLVVLAHPGLIEKDYPGRLPALTERLLALGLAGIETYYSRHTPEQTASYIALARRHGLLVTGGSDFHQRDETGPDLGVGFGNLRVPPACLTALQEALARIQ
ncbi:MAG: PHP domain-containing protein [Deltaproteobacteria bacterium]|nr:PHP domain-containing protein [Deltaproteobacteria bacterium]